MAGSFQRDYEPVVSIKGWEFVDQQTDSVSQGLCSMQLVSLFVMRTVKVHQYVIC
jgi:hypothetical protein